MKKIKIIVKFESGKKFYESDYKNLYDCFKASERDAVRKFRKKYPNAIIYDVFSRGSGTTSIASEILGYDSIYIERDLSYFEIAKERAKYINKDEIDF